MANQFQFTQSKRLLPSSNSGAALLKFLFLYSKTKLPNLDSGFTLVELLVSMVVASIVLSIAFLGASLNRKLYLEDQVRNSVNQNLRTALDLIGSDIKQVGEYLSKDSAFPVIQVLQTDITGTNPIEQKSEIVILRSLLDSTLKVCQNINAGTNRDNVQISDNGANPPAGCSPDVDANNDGWPDNLEKWRNYRLSHGGTVRAYIYDGAGNGEFFDYDSEPNSKNQIHKANNTNWQYSYNASGSSRVYLMEERRYRLLCAQSSCSQDNVLQLVTNENHASSKTLNLVNNLNRFKITVVTKNNSFKATGFCTTLPCPTSDSWTQIKSIQATVQGVNPAKSNLISIKANDKKKLQLTQQFFPRNTL